MSNKIVEVAFSSELRYHAVYRGYDGKILEWNDLDMMLSEDAKQKLPEIIRKQLGCDGTALFDQQEDAELVLKLLEEES